MEMTPLWKSAQDADSHSGLEKPRQERSAFPHFHRPDDEIKSTEKNFRKYFCRTSRTELCKVRFGRYFLSRDIQINGNSERFARLAAPPRHNRHR